MKKRLLILTVISIAMSMLAFSLYGCGNRVIVHTVRTVGTFSGYRVDCVWKEYLDADVATVVVTYTVDDVYIQTFPDPSCDYLVYTGEKDYVVLSTAYEQNLITHDDLLAIAEAEKPYDDLYRYFEELLP